MEKGRKKKEKGSANCCEHSRSCIAFNAAGAPYMGSNR